MNNMFRVVSECQTMVFSTAIRENAEGMARHFASRGYPSVVLFGDELIYVAK